MKNIFLLDNTLSFGLKRRINSMMNYEFIKSCGAIKGISMIDIGQLADIQDNSGWTIGSNHFDNGMKLSLTVDYRSIKYLNCKNVKQNRISIIRIFCDKNNLKDALIESNKLAKDNLQLYFCPNNISDFSDLEIISMVDMLNTANASALYICEKQGAFTPKDLKRQFSLIDHNLKQGIAIGIHIGINFSQGFKLIEDILKTERNREIIIDTSMLGIGKDGDYLNTELILENMDLEYDEDALFNLMEMIWPFTEKKVPWGYSPLSFLSAKAQIDIGYFEYYRTKGLSLNEMKNIVRIIGDDDMRYQFDKEYADRILEAWNERVTYILI